MMAVVLTPWAEDMRRVFRSDTVSQFILFGNIKDLVPAPEGRKPRFMPLAQYLAEVLLEPFETVIGYDRGRGFQLHKGGEQFFGYLQAFDKFHGTSFASDGGASGSPGRALESPGLLPRQPAQALELLDRFLSSVAAKQRNPKLPGAKSAAVILDHAHLLIPRGESLYMAGEPGTNLIRILDWAEDPELAGANLATVLLSESLNDLHEQAVNSPYSAKIQIKLPDQAELQEFLADLLQPERDFAELSEVDLPNLAAKMVGLSRVAVRNILRRALRNRERITVKYLSRLRKETIEKEAMGRLEFMESRRTLDDVAGHAEAKRWLRQDAQLIRKGASNALPMGYLVTGRIGTGKTYLVQCFAGECGIPFVEMKNFREKWVGATEGNLEKIFSILKALGQVVVFVDEADQATGKRGGSEGDSGLSGRVYGMLAREMAETANRGKIIWIFATSRPDLLEVDLKRQGRLDVHIPLFPPVDEADVMELFAAMAKKLGLDVKPEQLPKLTFKEPVSGNELEGIIVRAVREHELQEGEKRPLAEVLHQVAKEFRPSAHTKRLELMDLLAVKECTDARFLPQRFAELSPEEVDQRIARLSGTAATPD
jgi:SpoVK/Ycf46/Vps4 family AAA+-type ATPase